jgi:deazaflavin-dependent oxidoreductase (nitroreductase family)
MHAASPEHRPVQQARHQPVDAPVAPYLPGFGVVEHTGRTSGRHYRTPVNVFRRASGFVIALTYGRESDWVENVLAAGGCGLVIRGRRHRLVDPEVFRDESRKSVPAIITRPVLRAIGVADFMNLREEEPGEANR